MPAFRSIYVDIDGDNVIAVIEQPDDTKVEITVISFAHYQRMVDDLPVDGPLFEGAALVDADAHTDNPDTLALAASIRQYNAGA